MTAKPNPMHMLRDAWSGRVLYRTADGTTLWLRNGTEPVEATGMVGELTSKGWAYVGPEAQEEPPPAVVPYVVTPLGEDALMGAKKMKEGKR